MFNYDNKGLHEIDFEKFMDNSISQDYAIID